MNAKESKIRLSKVIQKNTVFSKHAQSAALLNIMHDRTSSHIMHERARPGWKVKVIDCCKCFPNLEFSKKDEESAFCGIFEFNSGKTSVQKGAASSPAN